MKAAPWIVAAVAVAALAANLNGTTEPETVAADYTNNVNYQPVRTTTDFELSDFVTATDIAAMMPASDIRTACDAFDEVEEMLGYQKTYDFGFQAFAAEFDGSYGITARDAYEAIIARC